MSVSNIKSSDPHETSSHPSGTLLLALGALGVVFGDIGTSPLYAVNELFFGHALAHYTRADVIGAISLIFWALTLIIAFKYVFFVMRADDQGEGGVYALFSQIRSIASKPVVLLLLLIFGSGLLYGDGIITPAISVISAIEGLKLITPALSAWVVPITISILTALFSIQYKGTHTIGKLFGPIMLLWFGTIACLGFASLLRAPEILLALNPLEAIQFFFTHQIHTILLTMGSVMLVITGGEAMFADMGHFGRLPIRISWYTVAYPALVLNYFGQGAYLLSEQSVRANNVFYSMVPAYLLPTVVILATFATIIASQAMISGAFSLTKQAISLRLLPYIPTVYTHKDHEGQIYIPAINWMLYAGAVLLVLIFQSSSKLAGAYGLAVAGDMLITTLAMMAIAISIWKWNTWRVYLFFGAFLLVDIVFLTANSLKLFEGGYIPLTIGIVMFSIINIWQWGRRHTAHAFEAYKCMTVKELVNIQNNSEHDIPRTVVFLNRYAITSLDQQVPVQAQLFFEKHGMLPQHMVFLTVELLKQPHAKERFTVNQLTPVDQKSGTFTNIIVRFGFMENPDLEPLLKSFIKHKDIPSSDPVEHWEFRVLHEKIHKPVHCSALCQVKYALYSIIHRLSYTTDHYLGLGKKAHCTIDVLPVTLQ